MINECGYVDIKHAWHDFWHGYFDYAGRTTRSGYWWSFLFELVLCSLQNGIMALLIKNDVHFGGALCFIAILLSLLIVLPLWAATVRRLHDLGFSQSFAVALLIAALVITNLFILTISFIVGIISVIVSVTLLALLLLPTDRFKTTDRI